MIRGKDRKNRIFQVKSVISDASMKSGLKLVVRDTTGNVTGALLHDVDYDDVIDSV